MREFKQNAGKTNFKSYARKNSGAAIAAAEAAVIRITETAVPDAND